MIDPKQPDDLNATEPEQQTNRRTLWWVLIAALVWGLMIGVGAFLQDYRRGLVVFGVVLTLAALWALLQLSFQRRSTGRGE